MPNKISRKKIYVHITSLGCPKNLVDTEIISGCLLTSGIGISSDPNFADAMLISTCAFIEAARNESAQHIKRAIAWKKKKYGRKIIVCGCLVQLKNRAKYSEILDEIDLLVGIHEIETIPTKILSLFFNQSLVIPSSSAVEYLPKSSTPRLQLTPNHYAYVKIADGCSNCCSYCSIPSIRGNFRSRETDDIIKEVSTLLQNGSKEIILIAQDSTNYGTDLKSKPNLLHLLKKLDKISGNFYLRLMYCHPKHFTAELLDFFEKSERLLPYVDLPLQHISDKILKAMNRGADEKTTRNLIHKLRSLKRKMAIRTSFICGFPGETDEDFAKLVNFIEETRFDRLGAFSYSPEPGTPAEKLKDKIPAKIADERRSKILQIQQKISIENNEKLIGKIIPTIIERKISNSKYIGRTIYDAPDIDNSAEIHSKKALRIGEILNAKVKKVSAYSITAEFE